MCHKKCVYDPELGISEEEYEETNSDGKKEPKKSYYNRLGMFYCPKLYAVNEAGLTIGGVVGIVIACVVVVAAVVVVTVICLKKKGSSKSSSKPATLQPVSNA